MITTVSKKPAWLNKRVDLAACRPLKSLLRSLKLHTVCEASLCPNISECFGQSTATFMILGGICTRSCGFCAVSKSTPQSVDYTEPWRIRCAVKRLRLKYVVITSPSRDDLPDGGARVFSNTVQMIKNLDASIKVEILIPDFSGRQASIARAANSGADVISHNLETVPSLYSKVRKGADYLRSLEVIRTLKEVNPHLYTKSGLMLGLGERRQDVVAVIEDLRRAGCDFLTLGQYMPPSRSHYPLDCFISPQEFEAYRIQALYSGFVKVLSAPYVRSSYMAHTFLE